MKISNCILILAISASLFAACKKKSSDPSPGNTNTVINQKGIVTTFAGSGLKGLINATGTAATFYTPNGVALDAAGNLYVADTYNNVIRKITPAGIVSTFAGSGTQGYADGTSSAASFYQPSGVAVDANGNVFVADNGNALIRKITPAGVVTTFAGDYGASWITGYLDGTGTNAIFGCVSGITIDASGNLYITENCTNQIIRKITPSAVVTTIAGDQYASYMDGTGTATSFDGPIGIAADASGNLYIADSGNNLIRKITPAGVVSTLAGLSSTLNSGNANGTGTAASFNNPSGIAVDKNGNIYVADTWNNLIRKITPAGVVTTLAGSGQIGSANSTIGTDATFYSPGSLVVSPSGTVYVSDSYNNLIREIQ